jgi:threonylcarbamoyl adenosine biosynthesis protein TsaE
VGLLRFSVDPVVLELQSSCTGAVLRPRECMRTLGACVHPVSFARVRIHRYSLNPICFLSRGVGVGKSELARAFIRHAYNDPTMAVPSPTFGLVQEYGDDGERLYRTPVVC